MAITIKSIDRDKLNQVKADVQSNIAARNELAAQQQSNGGKWYSGDQPTAMDFLRQIGTISTIDKTAAQQFSNQFTQLQLTPGTQYWNPYIQPTNKAVTNLQNLGVDTSKLDDDFYKNNQYLLQYLKYNGSTNTPSAPGKKASDLEKAAYEYYQLYNSEEQTRKAESEWAALQEELNYWANRTDLNLSDDQILARINWKNYSTLTKMDATRDAGKPMELNRAVGYSQDNLYGALWAARNGGGTGDALSNTALYAMGKGNKWKDNPDIAAKLDKANLETYSPYSVGMTMDDEGSFFGVQSFDQQWLFDNRWMLNSSDENVVKNYVNVMKAEETTLEAETAVAALNAKVDKWISRGYSEDRILKLLADEYESSDYAVLRKMDDGIKYGSPVAITRAIDYRYQDVLDRIHSGKVESKGKTSAADIAEGNSPLVPLVGKPEEQAEETASVVPEQGMSNLEKKINTKVGIQEEAMRLWREGQMMNLPDTTPGEGERENLPLVIGPDNEQAKPEDAIQHINTDALRNAYDAKYGEGAYDAAMKEAEEGPAAVEEPQVSEKPKTSGGVTLQGTMADAAVADFGGMGKPKSIEREVADAVDNDVHDMGAALEDVMTPTEQSVNAGWSSKGDAAISWYQNEKDRVLTAYRDGKTEEFQAIIDRGTELAMNNYISNTIGLYSTIQQYENTRSSLEYLRQQETALKEQLGGKENVGKQTFQKTKDIVADDGTRYEIQLGKDPSIVLAVRVNSNGYIGETDDPDNPMFQAAVNSAEGQAFLEEAKKEYASLGADSDQVLTEEDEQKISTLRDIQMQIQDAEETLFTMQTDYDDAVKEFDKWSNDVDMHVGLMLQLGMDTTDVVASEVMMRELYSKYVLYNPTVWDTVSIGNMSSDALAKARSEGASEEVVFKQAEAALQETKESLADAQYLKQWIANKGIKLPDDVVKNIDRQIAKLERDIKDYDYFMLQKNSDFAQKVAEGKNIDYNNAGMWSNLYPTIDEYYDALENGALSGIGTNTYDDTLLGRAHTVIGGKNYYNLLTSDEKDTYYYLLATQGDEEAMKYLSTLADPTYGVITTRDSMATSENWKELTANGIAGFLLGNVAATAMSPVTALASGAYSVYNKITGSEFNPYSEFLAFNTAKNAVREQSAEEIKKSLAKPIYDAKGNIKGYDDTFWSQAAQFGYEMLTMRADSAMNAAFFGPMFGGLTESSSAFAHMLGEFGSAAFMGMSAAADTAASAKLKGASDEQAYALATITFFAESVTEAISLENMGEALKLGQDGAVTGSMMKDFLKNWLTENGISEAFGEVLTDIIEKGSEDWIMPDSSEHKELINKYRRLGYGKTEAEWMARKDELGDLLRTAAISYLSPGLDVFQTAKGRYMTYRSVQDEMNQNGGNYTLRDARNKTLQEEVSARNKARQEQEAQAKFEEENANRELGPIQVNDFGADQRKEARNAMNSEQAEEAAINIDILEGAKDGDYSAHDKGVASVLDTENTQESREEAEAAAAAMWQVLGDESTTSPAEELQDLQYGAIAMNIDLDAVNNAFKMAALSAESACRKFMQSEGYHDARPDVKAAGLWQAYQKDLQNGLQNFFGPAVHEYNVAKVENDLLAQGKGVEAVRAAEEKSKAAQDTLRDRERDLERIQRKNEAAIAAKNKAKEDAVAMFLEDPANDNNRDAMLAATRDLENVQTNADLEEEKAQAEVEKAQAAAEEARKAETDSKNGTITAIRQEAEQIVTQREQERAQAKADAEAQAQQAAEEQARIDAQQAEEQAKQQAIDDVKSGKAADDLADEQIDAIVQKTGLTGNDAEALKKRLSDVRLAMKNGKIDTNQMVSTAEAKEVLGRMSRALNVPIVDIETEKGVRGYYENGIVYISKRLTLGQAAVEAALHEITHAVESTGSYATYAKIAMEQMFKSPEARKAAVTAKLNEYKKGGKPLTDKNGVTAEQRAERELVAEFTRTMLHDKDVVNRLVDSGLAGKIRNALHNANQYLKNMKIQDETARAEAEYLRRAERALQKAINERKKIEVHPDGAQFSLQQFAQAAGLYFDEDTLDLYDKPGGTKITEVTPDMIRNTPIGMMIDLAENGLKDKKGNVKLAPTIDKETAQKQRKLFADLMTMSANYKNSELVWEIAGSTLYSALKANSDTQYNTTVDFGTICAKTQEIVNVLSRVMQEKAEKTGDGSLTRADVLKVYNETAKAGLTVPCPVCYVFSRWMGVPSLLGQMGQYQKKYVVTKKTADGTDVLDENGKPIIDMEATKALVNKYLKGDGETKGVLEKYGSADAVKDARGEISEAIDEQEEIRIASAKVLNSETATAEEKEEAQKQHDDAVAEMVRLDKELNEVEAFNWVTQALCKQERKGKTEVNVLDENGNYEIDPEFEITPDNILFNLNKTGEFAKYTKNWKYRNSRGASMGKAIMPYSGASIGDIIHGVTRWSAEQNPFMQGDSKAAASAIRDAMERAKKQNLIGGQRLQSTSDFRPEWGLDYMMTFLEMQAIGSKVQMYTKVAEAVDLLASMGADINLSIMGNGQGWHIDDEGNMVLDFSSVTGMDYDKARALKDKYNNVQMILVGMNDTHIKLALANSDIDFVIPWHSSGNTKDALASMLSSVDEKLESSDDYQNCQSDKASKDQTEEQKNLWDLRVKILTGAELTQADLETIFGDKYLNRLYVRFNLEGADAQKAIDEAAQNGDDYLQKHYSRFGKDVKDADCFGVKLNAPQAKQIFPYEYWDTSLTKDQANDNGWNFIEYCQHFGMVPRFSGANQTQPDGKTKKKIGNFSGAVYDKEGAKGKKILRYDREKMYDGYWKLLIDRPMYNLDGTYRSQQVVDVTGAKVGHLEDGKLVDSDMPVSTSAKYTSEKRDDPDMMSQEDEAVYNALSAIERQYNIQGDFSISQGMTDADAMQMLEDANVEYMDAVERGDMETAQKLVDEKANQYLNGTLLPDDSDEKGFQYHRGPAPTKTFKRYAVLNVSEDGFRAAYAGNKNPTPLGVWLDAQNLQSYMSDQTQFADGSFATYIAGDTGVAAKEKFSPELLEQYGLKPSQSMLLERGGKHSSDVPNFSQMNLKQDEDGNKVTNAKRDGALPHNKLIFEIEYGISDNGDLTEYVKEHGRMAKGGKNQGLAKIGPNQYYDFKTNPNAVGNWGIGGTFRITRLVPYEEVVSVTNKYKQDAINDARTRYENGEISKKDMETQIENAEAIQIQKWVGGYHPEDFGLTTENVDEMVEQGSRMKLTDAVTYDDNGDVIPLNERFSDLNDIRYSLEDGSGYTDADIMQMLMDAGVDITPTGTPGTNERQFNVRTAQRNPVLAPSVNEMLKNYAGYVPISNKETMARAYQWVANQATADDPSGYNHAIAAVTAPDFNYASADGQAQTLAVMGMAVGNNDVMAQARLAAAYSQEGTDLARALQARKIFNMMTPEGRIMTMENLATSINEEIGKRTGTKGTLKISQETLNEVGQADTDEKMRKARKKVEKELGQQMPANWKDKLRSWRMLSMLMNPRTHIRNIMGNALFIPAVSLKNKLGAVMEMTFGTERTKTLAPILKKEYRDFANQDAIANRDVLTGEAKYNERSNVDRNKEVFGKNPLGRLLKVLSDFNSNALENEDWFFLKGHYRRALGGWMQANGYTVAQLQNSPELLEKGRAYAIEEAQKATYRDFNKLAQTLNKLSRDGGVAGFLVDATLPFKKTPANILKRGIEYSPVSVAKALTVDAYHLKQYLDYQHGKLDTLPTKAISPTQFIDRLCSGLAGSAILGIGALLGSMGVVTCGFDDDDDEFDELEGGQKYSIKILGMDATYTVDWAAPMSMPFFVGASIYDQLTKEHGEIDVGELVNSLANITEPVFNLSMLDGVNSLFRTSQYDDTNNITQIGAKILSNYATSYVPSAVGGIARTIDPIRRKSFVKSGEGGGVMGTFRYAIEQTENKLPGVSQTNIPTRDAFGRIEETSLLERLIENFVSPGYYSAKKNDPVVEELRRLFNEVDESQKKAMVPSLPNKSLKGNALEAEQYDKLTEERGQTAYELLEKLMDTDYYQNSAPEDQANMVQDVWTYATQNANHSIDPNYKVTSWVLGSRKDPISGFIKRDMTRVSNEKMDGWKNEAVDATERGDYDTIDDCIEALTELGVKDAKSSVKTAIGNRYKEEYIRAYQEGDDMRMLEIEEILLETGLGFDKTNKKGQDTFEQWIEAADNNITLDEE